LPSNNSIPYKTLFNKDVDYNFLRVLGCLCYPLTRPYNKHKLELRAQPCVFIGYGVNQKGYRCLHIPSGRIYVSRNVQFVEDEFPFSKVQSEPKEFSSSPTSVFPLFLLTSTPNSTVGVQMTGSSTLPPSSAPNRPSGQAVLSPTPAQDPLQPASTNPQPVIVYTRRNQVLPPIPLVPHPLNGTLHSTSSPSAIQPVPFLQAPVDHEPLPPPAAKIPPNQGHQMITCTKDRTCKKKEYPGFVSCHVSIESDPTTFTQAHKSPNWRSAMAEEITALANNQTWTLVPPPLNQKVIGSKWVFKTKTNPDGSIERYKARLVAKGFNQISGVDFEETYSPVVRAQTIRVTIALALTFHWSLRQLDVSNAFLNGDLKERVFMSQPQGFIDPNKPDYVYLLHKSLYGLRQAPRAWFEKLSSTLLSFGFKASHFDPSMFLAHHQGHILILLVYVDDIVITGSSPIQVDQCIQQLHSRFAIRDLGPLHYFLGLEATPNDQGLCLTQTKYLTALLTRVNMLNCKPCLSPMASGTIISSQGSAACKDPHQYRSVIGALQYATLTRPDLSFSVNKLSQYMHSPTEEHWTAAKRILRYVAGTLDHGLQFYKQTTPRIYSYSDSDWAGNYDDRRSTSGYCVYLGKNLVSWCAKKQPTVSKSSTEAEYRSLALCTQEVMWLEHLLKEIGIQQSHKPILWCDNIGATFLASNPQFHARTKHIEIDYHFVRERVVSNKLLVKFVCSKDQIADCMTKPLPLPHFHSLRRKLNVIQITSA
jgi:Reverse transcriptase (RNA-dependent DNA polymerase)